MEKICNEIDKVILAALPNAGLKAYGLCELIKKQNQPIPTTVDSTRKTAEIRSEFDGVFYHRLLSASLLQDEDMSFGDELSDRISARLRTVLAYKVHLGEDFIFDFGKVIPQKIELNGFKFIQRSAAMDLIADHEAVHDQEWGATDYERHRTPWNIFAIEYNVEFILC